MSLLTALLPTLQRGPDATAPIQVIEPFGQSLSTSTATPSGDSLKKVLMAFGVTENRADIGGDVICLALRSGIALVVSGPAACEFAMQIARAISKTSVRIATVPIGLLSTALPLEWFQSSEFDVVLIQNANLSDPVAFAPQLLSTLSRRLVDRTLTKSPFIVLTAATGPAALSWPTDIELLAAHVELAAMDRGIAGDVDVERNATTLHPLQRVAATAIERQAEKEEAPRDVVRTLLSLILRART
jgi:hypothetical protein